MRIACGRLLGSFLLLTTSPIFAAQPPLPTQLQDFDTCVVGVRKQFDVPGIAVAIVKDGEIVLERGYGVRELGKPEKVDAHTLFAIASNTKAFTAAALSILADEASSSSTIASSTTCRGFRCPMPTSTREMRLRDLLVHRSGSGLGAGDLLFWPATSYSTEDIVRRLRDVPLSGGFRAQYAYDNVLYAVAQLVIEKVSGRSYADFINQNIFAPVGMTQSRINSDALGDATNVAVGHAKFDFRICARCSRCHGPTTRPRVASIRACTI